MSGLRVGLLGLTGDGPAVLEAVRQAPDVELVAAADRDPELAEQVARESGAKPYDDYRSLIVESPLDVILAVDPPFATSEYLELAARRNMHAWRTAPWERSFERSARLVKAFDQAGRHLAIASPWRHVPGAPGEADERSLRRACLAAATSRRAWAGALGWLGDRQRSGGGALLHLAYPWVDWMTRLLGLPEAVMAGLGRARSWGSAGAHDTEDSAGVVLRYTGGRVATVTACWTTGPPDEHLLVFAEDACWQFALDAVRRTEAQAPERPEVMGQAAATCPAGAWQTDLGGFLADVAQGRQIRSGAAEHLAVMAILESAYLSARTGQPEQPARFYELHGLRGPAEGAEGGGRASGPTPQG